jgi:polyketide cyclase/dehydrase/lipid transport protein
MKSFKFFVVGFSTLFIVITLISLLLPAHVKVSRVVVIDAPADKIYTDVADFRNWKNWHPSLQNTAVTITYSDPSYGKNAFCDISNGYQKTHLLITDEDSSSVKFLSQLNGANDIDNEIRIIPVNGPNNFEVEWIATTKLNWYPWEKFYGIFIGRLTGPGYDAVLNDLKDSLEKIKQ